LYNKIPRHPAANYGDDANHRLAEMMLDLLWDPVCLKQCVMVPNLYQENRGFGRRDNTKYNRGAGFSIEIHEG
jgi:hypothetical protein